MIRFNFLPFLLGFRLSIDHFCGLSEKRWSLQWKWRFSRTNWRTDLDCKVCIIWYKRHFFFFCNLHLLTTVRVARDRGRLTYVLSIHNFCLLMYWSYIISISTKRPQISLVLKTAIPHITGWVQRNIGFVIKLLLMIPITHVQIDIESRVTLRKNRKHVFH